MCSPLVAISVYAVQNLLEIDEGQVERDLESAHHCAMISADVSSNLMVVRFWDLLW